MRGRTFATLYAVIRLCLLLSLTVSPLFADLYDWLFALVNSSQHVQLGGFSYSFPGVRLALWGGGVLTIVSGVYARRQVLRYRDEHGGDAVDDPIDGDRGPPTRPRPTCPPRARSRHDRPVRRASKVVTARGSRRSARGSSTRCGRGASTWSRRVEPGGTPLGAELRRLLLDGGAVDARAEALLMAADRAEHVATVIRPALARGAWVVSDRHVPSSLVYQGVVRGLGVDAVAALSAFATDGLEPDLVIVLDVDDATAESRRAPGSDRLEREGRDVPRGGARPRTGTWRARRGWTVVDGSGAPGDGDRPAARRRGDRCSDP